MEMPATHFTAWERHLRDFPPGDFLTQTLVADLIHVVETFMCGFAGKDAKPRARKDIAPWLDTRAAKRVRERELQHKRMATVRQIINNRGGDGV